jgi:hypothetical protein
LPFSEAIRGGRSRVREEAATEGLHRYCAYVERGLYGEQLTYLAEHFPKRTIHCEIFEELFGDRSAGLQRIAKFLGIGDFFGDIPELRINAAHDYTYPSALTDDDVRYLSDMFRKQISTVEFFLGRPIAAWNAGRAGGA